ncbi:MAG: YnbE family lipoprotein [Haemophilus parainfluenzae]|nr:YnbE family lipoprotein [Haemophilus parainfluenzae]
MIKYLKFQPHFFIFAAIFTLTACTPTIQLDTPKEGITINMNVVVDHNIKVEMDEKSQKAVSEVDSSKK